MLSRNPSKQEEINHLRAFVEALPQNSYLAALFADILPYAGACILDDMVPQTIADIWRHRQAEQALNTQAREDCREKMDLLRAELAELERKRDRLMSALNETRTAARYLARLAG